MLRSILYQILRDEPSLWIEICGKVEPELGIVDGKSQLTFFSNDFEAKVWHLEELQRLLMSLGSKYREASKLRIYIFVDAVDESEKDQILDTVSSLFKISKYRKDSPMTVKPMVASRPDSLTELTVRKCLFVLLEEETFSNIFTFVNQELTRIATEVPSLTHQN